MQSDNSGHIYVYNSVKQVERELTFGVDRGNIAEELHSHF